METNNNKLSINELRKSLEASGDARYVASLNNEILNELQAEVTNLKFKVEADIKQRNSVIYYIEELIVDFLLIIAGCGFAMLLF